MWLDARLANDVGSNMSLCRGLDWQNHYQILIKSKHSKGLKRFNANAVGSREEASYVSLRNQTTVVRDDLDNASCERAFVVVMWGCGLRVEKGLMIMK